jgi:hypothetical protein
MTNKRELCITTDPYAYSPYEIDIYTIKDEYDPVNDYITYQWAPTFGNTPEFTTLRVTAQNESESRETITEEATDQAAAASLFGGTINLTGGFTTALRGWDFATSGLLEGIMGEQTAVTIANPGTSFTAGLRYEFETVPKSLALKYVDEQANANAGVTRIYRGVGITQANITLRSKQYVTVDVQWMARKAEVFDLPYPTESEPKGDPAMFYNAVLKWTPEGGSASIFKCQEFTLNIARPIDTDDYMVGSQFLNSLTYNGLSDLGGSITLAATDWDKMRTVMVGTSDTSINTLDEGRKEFFGVVTNTTTTTVLANAIPAGQMEIILHTPTGVKPISRILVQSCKLTETTATAEGKQKYTKTITWKAVINNTSKFYFDVWDPSIT